MLCEWSIYKFFGFTASSSCHSSFWSDSRIFKWSFRLGVKARQIKLIFRVITSCNNLSFILKISIPKIWAHIQTWRPHFFLARCLVLDSSILVPLLCNLLRLMWRMVIVFSIIWAFYIHLFKILDRTVVQCSLDVASFHVWVAASFYHGWCRAPWYVLAQITYQILIWQLVFAPMLKLTTLRKLKTTRLIISILSIVMHLIIILVNTNPRCILFYLSHKVRRASCLRSFSRSTRELASILHTISIEIFHFLRKK